MNVSDYSNVYLTIVVPWDQVNSRNFTTKSNLIKPNLPNLISFENKKKCFICIADRNANFTTILLLSIYIKVHAQKKTSMFTRGCYTIRITGNCITAGVYIFHVQIYIHMGILLKVKK